VFKCNILKMEILMLTNNNNSNIIHRQINKAVKTSLPVRARAGV